MISKKPPLPFKFTGTLDGPDDFDVVSFSNLELTDDQINTIWSITNSNAILEQCSCVSIIEENDFDGMPGQSDTFFKYEATSKKFLREELKVVILAILPSRISPAEGAGAGAEGVTY